MGRHLSWFLGTIGYSYPAWEGIFYPPKLAPDTYLQHYSRYFNAVEINATFYAPPKTEQLARWKSQTGPNFRFCLKTPREITHEMQLSPGAIELMHRFVDSTAVLAAKLGPLLIQLPPKFGPERWERLTRFLEALPPNAHYALEVRHPAWFARPDDLAAVLQTCNIAWVSLDYTQVPNDLYPTADFLYIRWLGEHNRYDRPGRQVDDRSADLKIWLEKISPQRGEGKNVFGFFNDDYAGYGPDTCNQFKTMLGLPSQHPQILRQGRLF